MLESHRCSEFRFSSLLSFRAFWGFSLLECMGISWRCARVNGVGVQKAEWLLARQESPMRTKLQPQFLSQRLTLLEAREELIEKADDDCVDADAFGFGPVFEFGASLRADVEELGISQVHTGF